MQHSPVTDIRLLCGCATGERDMDALAVAAQHLRPAIMPAAFCHFEARAVSTRIPASTMHAILYNPAISGMCSVEADASINDESDLGRLRTLRRGPVRILHSCQWIA